MDTFERRLTDVLARAAEQADPAAARLRNPAERRPQRTASRFRIGQLHTGWAVAAASFAVVGVAVGLTAAIPTPTRPTSPGQAVTLPAIGTSDGVHPLWRLTVTEQKPVPIEQLSSRASAELPVPYAVDPALVPNLTKDPLLVTAAGTIRFSHKTTRAVHLIAQRSQGIFIATTGTGHDGEDGLYDVRILLVGPDNTQRELYHAPSVEGMEVSPSGTTLAVTVMRNAVPTIELIDVGTGKVEHQLPGRFTAWASDHAIVLKAPTKQATRLVWRAPWTSKGEPADASGSGAVTPDGLVLLSGGCLQRLDADGMVVDANCNHWSAGGNDSPDGRYLALEWGNEDHPKRGYLDVAGNQVRSWPAAGMYPSWLSSTSALLTDTAEDSNGVARCEVTTNVCAIVPEDPSDVGIGRGASWIGNQ